MREKKTPSKLRVLGEGSYGCVVSRPLECSGKETIISTKKGKKDVAKLFYENDKYAAEVRLGKLVKEIDPSEERMLVPKKGCAIARKTLYKPENIGAIAKCENIKSITSVNNTSYGSNTENVWQLTMPYGGANVEEVLQRYKARISVRSLAKMMVPLFEALVMLKEKRMVHQDIKVDNVLLHHRKMILIDYSLMLPFEDIYKESNYYRLKRRYRPFPPEYYMVSILMKHKSLYKGMSRRNVMEDIADRYKAHLEKCQYYFFPYYTLNQLMEESNYGSLSVMVQSDYKKMREYTDKIDIFSVGTLITSVHEHISRPMSNPDFVELMRGILHPDPRQRMSPEDALALCVRIAEQK
jgi:serine/threonine protein kinase